MSITRRAITRRDVNRGALRALGLGLAAGAGWMAQQPFVAHAQSPIAYPTRTVTVIVPQAPGGTNDALGRILAQKLTERLGQTFVVENRVVRAATSARRLPPRRRVTATRCW